MTNILLGAGVQPITVRTIGFADLKDALAKGLDDFLRGRSDGAAQAKRAGQGERTAVFLDAVEKRSFRSNPTQDCLKCLSYLLGEFPEAT